MAFRLFGGESLGFRFAGSFWRFAFGAFAVFYGSAFDWRGVGVLALVVETTAAGMIATMLSATLDETFDLHWAQSFDVVRDEILDRLLVRFLERLFHAFWVEFPIFLCEVATHFGIESRHFFFTGMHQFSPFSSVFWYPFL
jgi:hypothetical protein